MQASMCNASRLFVFVGWIEWAAGWAAGWAAEWVAEAMIVPEGAADDAAALGLVGA